MLEKLKETFLAKLLLVIILSWIVLAIIFGFTDLEISKAVVDRDFRLAKFLYFFEAPGWGLSFATGALWIGSYIEHVRKQKIPAIVLIVIGLILFVISLIFWNAWLLNLSAGMTFANLFLLIIFSKKDWRQYKNIATVFAAISIINSLLFVQVTKLLCGRIRFKYLATGYTNYTPWFLPPGPDFGNFSFPSGHTAQGWLFLPFLILVKDRKWPYRIIVTILTITWGTLVGISTIITGAHFASDVLFSTGVGSVLTILLYNKVYLKKE
ncbi:MAG: phosphatase PAP2 family protein [Candidatus Hodarchaeota archaeon]